MPNRGEMLTYHSKNDGVQDFWDFENRDFSGVF